LIRLSGAFFSILSRSRARKVSKIAGVRRRNSLGRSTAKRLSWRTAKYFTSIFQKNVISSRHPASMKEGVLANRHRT
jgi:hypothetical protein